MMKTLLVLLASVLMTGTSFAQLTPEINTELPAAATLSDATSNPTVTSTGSFSLVWDGSTNWKRLTVGTAGTASAQVLTIQGIASMTPLQVQSNSVNLATQTTVSAINDAVSDLEANTDGLETALNTIITSQQLLDDAVYTEDGDITADTSKFLAVGCWFQSTPSPITDGDGGFLHCDNQGSLKVVGTFTASLVDTGSDPITENAANAMRTVFVDGAGVIIDYADLTEDEDPFTYATTPVVAIAAVAESTVDTLADGQLGAPAMTLSRSLRVTPTAYSTGGGTVTRRLSVGTTEDEHAVCTGPCTLYSIIVTNTNVVTRYLKCENDTAAGTLPGTDVPEFSIAIPPSGGAAYPISVGAAFSVGLTCWLVTGAADNDVTEVGANEIMVNYVTGQ